ncbi:MAG: hypothetical protein IPJ65_31020 [Archangiaceae bacterium]|nr:hypothetical protein [Archangiaceae bacterium]
MSKKEKTYVAAPEVPAEMVPRFQLVLAAISGQTPVSEAARQLNMSRNHFQTLMHRGLHGLLEAIQPQPPGRPPKPKEQVELEQRAAKLERENEMLRARVATVDRLLGVAADFASGRLKPARQMGAKPTKTESSDEPSEPDGPRLALVHEARCVKAAGLELSLVSRAAGLAPSTVRRWCAREAANEPLVCKRGPKPRAKQLDATAAEAVVRSMNGQIGAAALAKCCEGLSRRGAARLKSRVLTSMENERQAEVWRVRIVPGAVRAFDAMHFENAFAFVGGDAGIPFRTSLELLEEYVGPLVAKVMDEDFTKHGAPLVARLDRAKQHLVPEVQAVLAHHRVLLMHGPPRYPRFYGQLERMNEEHRAFLGRGRISAADLEQAQHAYNEVLRRQGLGWRTAGETWRMRKPLDIDRRVFRDEVDEVTAKLKEKHEARAWCWGTAERLAIEAVLKRRGLLSVERGGWC